MYSCDVLYNLQVCIILYINSELVTVSSSSLASVTKSIPEHWMTFQNKISSKTLEPIYSSARSVFQDFKPMVCHQSPQRKKALIDFDPSKNAKGKYAKDVKIHRNFKGMP